MKFSGVLALPALKPIGENFKVVQRYEKMGFHSVWMSDHILRVSRGVDPENLFVPDAFGVLTAAAMTTERLRLGTAVTCPHRRSPAMLAQMVSTLDHISNGRVMLGIGVGEAMNLDPFGIEWDHPLLRMEESIEVIKRLWTEKAPFDYEGRFFKVKNGALQIDNIQTPHPPIYIASNGPKSRYLTGKVADGWLPIMESVETYRTHVKDLEHGARAAGRSMDEIDCTLFVYTAISDDHDAALEALKPVRSGIVSLGYRKLIEAGYDVHLPEGVSKDFYFDQLLIYHETEEMLDELGELISTDMIEDFCLMGTKDEVIDKIEKYVSVGTDHFIIINVGPDRDETNTVFSEEIMPYFREL